MVSGALLSRFVRDEDDVGGGKFLALNTSTVLLGFMCHKSRSHKIIGQNMICEEHLYSKINKKREREQGKKHSMSIKQKTYIVFLNTISFL
jgi:hypothetical protein